MISTSYFYRSLKPCKSDGPRLLSAHCQIKWLKHCEQLTGVVINLFSQGRTPKLKIEILLIKHSMIELISD